MSLSICLITRNQENAIEQALRSLANLRAEVLVGDTGSTDGTCERARELGARVLSLEWQEDFAAAQNQTLASATGDWVLWMNPDEEYVGPPADELHAYLQRPEALAYLVHIQHLREPRSAHATVETIFPRLFRRAIGSRYQGRLHPHLVPSLEQLAQTEHRQIYPSEIRLCHHAYLSELTPAKLRWATRLLKLELADRPGHLHYQIEYGRNMLLLNDAGGHEVLAEAGEMLQRHRDDPVPPLSTAASLLEYLLTVSPEQSKSSLTREQAAELARKWFPTSPPLLWAQAEQSFLEGRFADAARFLEQLVRLGRERNYDRSTPFDPGIIGADALMNLGLCRLRMGDGPGAEVCFGPLVDHPVHGVQARRGYAQARKLAEAKAGDASGQSG